MKQALKGFLCTEDVKLILGDTHEVVLFFQTAVQVAGIDPYIDDSEMLISTLDEQVKALFSPELQITAVDSDTMTPASRRSEEIFLAISTIEDITVH